MITPNSTTGWLGGEWWSAGDYALTRWLFLRLLGLIYFFAFASLWPQIQGLIGGQGILPAASFLDAAQSYLGSERFRLAPTLAWINSSDGFLMFLCGGGAVLSVLLVAGVLPVVVLSLLWLFYLSLVSIGQDFLAFQWDILLLEAGFLAIWFAPPGWFPRLSREPAPPRPVLWLLRLLLFRLMLFSGIVKLASGDPTWRDLTALAFHYETQPIPTPFAWYAHQLPLWFNRLSAGAMLAVELIVPWFIFGPRRLRRVAAAIFVGLQVLIILTGNYGFFNLLAIVLTVPLLDDMLLRRVSPVWLRTHEDRVPAPLVWRGAVAVAAAFVLLLSVPHLTAVTGAGDGLLTPVRKLGSWMEPFRVVNSYGLFAVMTTSRPEIVVEGSADGRVWKPYAFRYKPGQVKRPPPWSLRTSHGWTGRCGSRLSEVPKGDSGSAISCSACCRAHRMCWHCSPETRSRIRHLVLSGPSCTITGLPKEEVPGGAGSRAGFTSRRSHLNSVSEVIGSVGLLRLRRRGPVMRASQRLRHRRHLRYRTRCGKTRLSGFSRTGMWCRIVSSPHEGQSLSWPTMMPIIGAPQISSSSCRDRSASLINS